jgi:hypothetical protein
MGRLSSLWNAASSVASTAFSVAGKAAKYTTIGAAVGVVSGRLTGRDIAIASSSALEGIVGGAASMFGDGAKATAQEWTRWGAGKISGVDMNKLSKAEQESANGWKAGGEVAGVVGTFLIPGGIIAKGAVYTTRGLMAATTLIRAERASTAIARLSTATSKIPLVGTAGWGSKAAGGLGHEIAHAGIDEYVGNTIGDMLSSGSKGKVVGLISPAHAATANADITTGGASAFATSAFTRAAADGNISNTDIAALKENAATYKEGSLKNLQLSDADRAVLNREAINIIKDFDKNPPAWTDARIYRLQIILGIDADSICGNDTNAAIKQFKLDNKAAFTSPAPVMAPP